MTPDPENETCEQCAAYVSCVGVKRVNRPVAPPQTRYPSLAKEELNRRNEKPVEALDMTGVLEDPATEAEVVQATPTEAAIIMLQKNGNKLPQVLLWRKLTYYGHVWDKTVDTSLRKHPRLQFIGLNVLLSEAPSSE